MILSDLMHASVVDAEGNRLGRVIDARFVVDGTPRQLLADARLVGFIVSAHSYSSFLGYERLDIRAPWPIAPFLRWRHRGSFLVRWEDVAMLSAGTVRLRDGYRRKVATRDSLNRRRHCRTPCSPRGRRRSVG
ncbi:PRC-barrel domain-containing protein, partial [Rhizobium johnstonii]|uniref:PRC-barrel domain-containing protein n=1 Tax=Rhizobium johnstonii TaxID=3019933 RepID=UPI003F9BAED5